LSNVGMIILQFGGNSVPAIYNAKSINDYCELMQAQIRKIRSACPGATILFIGPSDMSTSYKGSMQTYRLLPEFIDKLREMCLRNNVAYWDLFEMMGGRNSMVAWVRKGWAGPDYIHFTSTGAQNAGKQLSDNFATMYEIYKTRRRMGSEQFDNLWEAAEQ
ncbi:MAG: GDSL-type esterase/lipase family protein, partial [Bacteroidales bacterium]|nr:GDSL-type esterase/lipase family protein [Bacteroidales bacterium]